MTTTYETLMTGTDEQVVAYLPPADAKKFFTRIRKVSFYVRTSVDLYTDFDEETGRGSKGFLDMGGNVPISVREANKMMDGMIRFENTRKESKGEVVNGMVKVTRLGGCVFIG
ncbi:hypothetical protein RDJLphi1_gp52 [Roseobacter phage RDJL Phi 1]|uniref:Uncharacterized protein n=1 Tax=Roseobacter phage RDJL Phi 1 TaxID=562742 RepID=F4YXR3_9CAUD|nr:hypothetical protein RDJLphi1_gp52 [Roseobacter phage RDJL Phi 1]ADK73453.1 hypothetical protein RDJLphi1_gp52 [Roseobacter phage RDJL Phi 1]